MGVNLSSLIPVKQIEFFDLANKTIAVDAFNTMFQFISVIRDKFTGEPLRDSKGNITSHLSGLFYRTARLMENGAEVIYVFDGKSPEFKRKTIQEREKIREEARKKWIEAVERGEEAKKYAQGASSLTGEMIEEAKKLLETMGVGWVQAPSEGEAQATYMCRQGLVWASASQDWDSVLFATPRFLRNLTISGKKKLPGKQTYVEVRPELIEIEDVKKSLGLDQDQIILLGILIGTDYNPGGVKGVGPKTALKLVKEHKTLEALGKSIEWTHETSLEEIFEFFKNPPVEDCKIEKKKLDLNMCKELLLEHDFSEERINSTLEKLEKTKKQGQTGLSKFF